MRTKLPIILVCFLLFISSKSVKAQNDSIPDYSYFPPNSVSKNVAILFLGGSEGSLPTYYDTAYFTSQGYACLVLGYFGTQNTPDRLEMIPLEYFEKALEMFTSKPEVKNKKILVWGGSKGGELALLLASRYKEIQGVIATVPSSVVFQGIGGRPVSSWSYNDESLPFVPYVDYDWSKIKNSQYAEMYKLSLDQTEDVKNAAIEVEKINGPILILSGKSDTMWPSSQMGDMIMKRLDDNKFPFWHKHFAYENAGHSLNESYMMGGTEEGNRKARIDSQKRLNDFLQMLSQ